MSFPVKPLKYGDFLFAGKRTYEEKNQYIPDVEEFSNIIDSEDHSIPLNELISRLETDQEKGLKEDQVDSMRETYGSNILKRTKGNKQLLFSYRNRGTFYFLCIGIAFTTVFVPSLQSPVRVILDNLCIGCILLVMAVISLNVFRWQNIKCIQVRNSFQTFYPQYASVIRDGKKRRLHRSEIVVGDLVLLKAGNVIPADIRVTQAWNLKVLQYPIANSKAAIPKTPECNKENPIVSQNVVFNGTMCLGGYGQGIAIATGESTAYGQMMQKMVVLEKWQSDSYAELRRNLKKIGLVTTIVCSALLFITILEDYLWITTVVLILALIITSMPDILYSAFTACFSWSAKQMISKHILPRNFEAIEKIGFTTVICCDKTGTITQNRMTIVQLWLDGHIIKVTPSHDQTEFKLEPLPNRYTWDAFLRAASVCSTIESKSRRSRCVIKKGCSCNQTEVAIMEFIICTSGSGSASKRIDKRRKKYKKVFEVPHSSNKMYHTTIHHTDHLSDDEACGYLLCMKGAVEEIIRFCSTFLINGVDVSISRLDDFNFQRIFVNTMEKGERVIGFCDYHMPKEAYPHGHVFKESDIPLEGLRFLGFVSILDPPRPPVPESVRRCRQAGIQVILMTGDHPVTAKAVARHVGIISETSETKEDVAQRFRISTKDVTPGHAKAAVITGSQLESMGEKDILQLLYEHEEIVFARINSSHKLKVVKVLQNNGELVAVTGDVIEDSEAMSAGNIGIGMGIHGSDICREKADVILLGDNFDSIIEGIEIGRVTYDNLRKAIVYVLSSNLPEILSLLVACILHIPFTLGASFILLITLIAETFPVLLLTQEKPESKVMSGRKFGGLDFFDHRVVQKAIFQNGVFGILSGLFLYFQIMAENGFMPRKVIGIAKMWDNAAINDFTDCFNQEWTYKARKSLEFSCQTAFFLSIMILQSFNFAILRCRTQSTRCCKLSKSFAITTVYVPGTQILVILVLMYIPGISEALHICPLKWTDWFLCLPFAMIFTIYEQLRQFLMQHSPKDSWMEREF